MIPIEVCTVYSSISSSVSPILTVISSPNQFGCRESLTQRVPPEQLCYDIPLKDRPLRTISGSQETVSQMDDRQLPDDGQPQMTEVERKILQQMSSGFGTQQSKDEPTVTESLEMRSLNPINSSEIDPNEQSIHISDSQPYDEAYLQYQKSLLNRSPSYRKSLDRTSSRTSSAHSLATSLAKCHSPLVQEVLNAGSTYLRNSNISLIQTPTPVPRREDNHFLVADRKSSLDKSITASPPQPISQQRSPSTSSSMRKAVLAANRFSDQSLNTLSIDHDELINQMNLKDELLNCEQKELFQFLNDEVDNSNNYFSDTVGYGSAVVDADTESLLLSSKKDDLIYSPDRKVSNGSLKSNLSSISNSIFQALENRRGGSISGSMDKPRPTIAVDNGSLRSRRNIDDKEPLVKASEFDDIIHSFDTELKSLKSLSLGRSHSQADAPVSPERERRNSKSCPTMPAVEEVVRLRRPNETSKRRSLEKQRNITDEEFNMGVEIKKLCDQLQAPFAAPTVVQEQPKSSSANGLSTLTPFTGLSAGGGNNMSSIPIVFRRKNDFHSSFDRIKRLSLIERVEECNEDEKAIAQPPKASSEILPRKQLSKDCLETLSLKSSYSVENGDKPLDDSSKKIGISLEEFQRNIAQESSSEPPAIRQPPKKTVTYSETSRQNSSQQATPKRTPFKTYESDAPLNLAGKPWHCLVSYVDDITVGGRRNSQGVYDDPMAFPSFGRRKAPKIPQDCFPQKCYEK
ncbi:AAEL015344-PA [Aedes aegypti]|uniref:AAEL015344-PA n=1 Tax=Aedes aegypti TaxID=7159 RepID=Q16E79_AEDAE|nr:AAEL015344-PA [Aedes aegypti]